MGRYYAVSRPRFFGRTPHTFVADEEQTCSAGGPLIVVDTRGNEALAQDIARLLNKTGKKPIPPREGEYRAIGKPTGHVFSGFAARLLWAVPTTKYTADGTEHGVYWSPCANVDDRELAERIARLLNSEGG